MIKYYTVKDIANLLKISTRQVRRYITIGKFPGSIKGAKSWKIPEESFNKYMKTTSKKNILAPNTGITDYRIAASKFYYVDKTLLIRDIIDDNAQVHLITRPEKFGKTLALNMLKTFFEISKDKDTSIYFKDKLIWNCGEKYRKLQGKFPVIYLSFKDIRFQTWEETFEHIASLIASEYSRHKELLNNDYFEDIRKEYFIKVLNSEASFALLTESLKKLSEMLFDHYGIAPIILIDEYDEPIKQGLICGFHDKIITFMRNLLSGAFKDNAYISYGVITGILKFDTGSIFTGLNNIKINTIFDNKYSEYFGFTENEVIKMAKYYKCVDKIKELSEWYGGYNFGNMNIYNPWSVTNYFNNNCLPKTFWKQTSNSIILNDLLAETDSDFDKNVNTLLHGGSIISYIDTNLTFPIIQKTTYSIYNLLLLSGYLRINKSSFSDYDDYICELQIPNIEIKNELLRFFS